MEPANGSGWSAELFRNRSVEPHPHQFGWRCRRVQLSRRFSTLRDCRCTVSHRRGTNAPLVLLNLSRSLSFDPTLNGHKEEELARRKNRKRKPTSF